MFYSKIFLSALNEGALQLFFIVADFLANRKFAARRIAALFFLALPTKVYHWLHNYDRWKQFSPKNAKCGVGCSMNIVSFNCGMIIDSPKFMFG